MNQKKQVSQRNDFIAEFGYYPKPIEIETGAFSVKTLPNHKETVDSITSSPNVVNGWIYPGRQQVHIMGSGVRSMPFNSRVFGMPKTHILHLHNNSNKDDLEFVVWCLSFFKGIRLTLTEAGFLDAATIHSEKLTDFILSSSNEKEVIELALRYLASETGNPLAPKRVAAVIHALFLAQNPQSLAFEQFQYLYMALDGCFALIWAAVNKTPEKRPPNHYKRIKWMCKMSGMPIPSWATGKTCISAIRNDNFHEAIFHGQPLGFASFDHTQTDVNQENIPLQMQELVCRLLAVILGVEDCSYITSSIYSRQYYPLKLKHESKIE